MVHGTYKGVTVKLKIDPLHHIMGVDKTKEYFKEPVLIGFVQEQSSNERVAKWVAYDPSKRFKTFAHSRIKAVYQLIEKINAEYAGTDAFHFHEEGMNSMRETIREEEALYLLQSRGVAGVGFSKATFANNPKQNPIEDGWFDLTDTDIEFKIREDHILFELWFRGAYEAGETIEDERTVEMEREGQKLYIKQIKKKVKIMVADLDYVVSKGTRYMIQKQSA